MLASLYGWHAGASVLFAAARSWYTYCVWVVLRGNARALEQESHAGDVLALAIAESIHELAKRGCALNLKENLVVVVGDLDVQVLRGTSILRLLRWRTVVGHRVGMERCRGVGAKRAWCDRWIYNGARLFLVSVGNSRAADVKWKVVERRGNYLLYATEVTVWPAFGLQSGSGDRKLGERARRRVGLLQRSGGKVNGKRNRKAQAACCEEVRCATVGLLPHALAG